MPFAHPDLTCHTSRLFWVHGDGHQEPDESGEGKECRIVGELRVQWGFQ